MLYEAGNRIFACETSKKGAPVTPSSTRFIKFFPIRVVLERFPGLIIRETRIFPDLPKYFAFKETSPVCVAYERAHIVCTGESDLQKYATSSG